MTLATHVAVGGLVLYAVGDPAVAATVNMALHPVLDAIPHAEWTTFVNLDRRDRGVGGLFIALDLLATVGVLGVLFTALPYSAGTIWLNLAAATWMDWLYVIAGRHLPWLSWLNHQMHAWPTPITDPIDWSRSLTGRTPTWVKLIIQIVLTAVPTWVIYRASSL